MQLGLWLAYVHQQSLPDVWKRASVYPVYKKGDKGKSIQLSSCVPDLYFM